MIIMAMESNDTLAHAYAARREQTSRQLRRPGMDTIPSKHQMLLDPGLFVETSRPYSPACAAGACGSTAPMCSQSSFPPMRSLAGGGQQFLSSASYPGYSAATAAFPNMPDVHIPDVISSYAFSHADQPSDLHMDTLFLPDQHHPVASPSLLSFHDQSQDAVDTQSVFASSVDSYDPILSSAATTASTNTPFFPPLDEQWIPPPPQDYFFDTHIHSSLQTGGPRPPLTATSPLPQPTPTVSTPSTTTTTRAHSTSSTKDKDLSHYGVPNPDGSWRCAYPSCTSQTVFRRGCDLRKHYNRHRKHLFCRHKGCPQAVQGGFSSKKDRDRHETKHNPGVPCEWDGCPRMFSRVDNMKDHVRRIHRRGE